MAKGKGRKKWKSRRGKREKGMVHKEMVKKDGDQKYKQLERHKRRKQRKYGSRASPSNVLQLSALRLYRQVVFQSFTVCVNKEEMILSTSQKIQF